MQWKIKQFVFLEDQQLLKPDNRDSEADFVELEPKQAEVLAYFCRNPNQLISRDELVSEVWAGQAVTDNAVNRIIAKLRKSLGDSAKQSEFIVTLPRKGYRFISPVEHYVGFADGKSADKSESGTQNLDSGTLSKTNDKSLILKPWFLIAALFIILGIGWTLLPTQTIPTQPYQFESVTALTRDSGEEFLPSLSPNGQFLIYAAYRNRQLDLYLKDTRSGQSRLISDKKGNAGNGDWSRDGTQYVYFYNNDKTCELRVATFDPLDSMKLTNTQTVYKCKNKGFGSFAFGHDGRSIIFSEIDDKLESFHIYVKRLDQDKIERIAQPPIFLAGNREFDLHPTENKLLIASPDATQNLTFYVSDLDKGTLDKKFSMEGYICCPVWGTDGDRIVMIGQLPAYTIVEMDLDGKNLRTIYSAPHSIHRLRRAHNKRSFVYSGGIQNTDIQYHDLINKTTEAIVSSTVPDYLPIISNNTQYLAYISQRSGNSEVWIRDLKQGTDRKLTQFADNHQYFDMRWSPNDQKILALTINGLKLIDFISGQDLQLNIEQQQIRGISWLDDNRITFSLKNSSRWFIYQYDLVSKQLTKLSNSENVAYVSFDPATGIKLSISEDNQLLFQDSLLSFNIENPIDHNRRFNFQFFDGHLYYLKPVEQEHKKNSHPVGYHLVKVELKSEKSQSLYFFEHPTQFTVTNKGVYYSELSEKNADIFRVDFRQ